MLSYNRQRSLQNYLISTHTDFAKTYENMSDGQLLQRTHYTDGIKRKRETECPAGPIFGNTSRILCSKWA
jgi:hypothetical protein